MYNNRHATRSTSADGDISLIRVRALQGDDEEAQLVSCAEPVSILIEYEILKPVPGARLAMNLTNDKGQGVFGSCDYDDRPSDHALNRPIGSFVSRVTIPADLLSTAYVSVYFDIRNVRMILAAENVLQFTIFDPRPSLESERHERFGPVAPLLRWEAVALTGLNGSITGSRHCLRRNQLRDRHFSRVLIDQVLAFRDSGCV
jgi:hypothetical protein